MTFSNEWENLYKNQTHMSIWPWSDLVSYVMRYADIKESNYNVLEIGCGAGANIPFFKKLGVNYYGIEGSSTIVNYLHKTYPELKNNILLGDFTKEIPFSVSFDLIIDRGSLTHNSTSAIQNTIKLLYPLIKDKGKFIGIDWFSTESSEIENGSPTEDINTRKNYTKGPYTGVGLVHFSDRNDLQKLFNQFEFNVLEHKNVCQEIPDNQSRESTWNFVVTKK